MGNGQSQIDYILCTDKSIISDSSVLHDLCDNTSSHVPIRCVVSLDTTKFTCPEVRIQRFRKQWNLCDTALYKRTVHNTLEHLSLEMGIATDIDNAVSNIQDALLKAESKSVSKKVIKLHGPAWKASPKVKDILRRSKNTYKQWLSEGKPAPEHPLSVERKNIKFELRRIQRQERADERNTFYNKIMEEENTSNFYKLLNRNNRGSRSAVSLNKDGELLSNAQQQCLGFAAYYEDLAIPKDSSEFDSDYKDRLAYDLYLMRSIATHTSDDLPDITADEVRIAVRKLHNNKAADEFGLVSEHVKCAGPHILEPLATVLSAIVNTKHIPEQFKSGLLHPIHKKGKDASLFSNYRGITVTSLIGKLFEHVILHRIEDFLPKEQSPLQFGFTRGLSPLMAALILSETVVEQTEKGMPLYLSFLDTQKAFDVVSHVSMKCKLFHQGINKHIWSTVDTLYSALSSKVMWNNHVSPSFQVLQGVRQGGILSTGLYKMYINDLLLQLDRAQIGTHIGTTYTGCPTVADDLTLSNESATSAQCSLDIAYKYANRERYIIHPEKSAIIRKYLPRNCVETSSTWTLGEQELSQVSKSTHLGLIRSTSDDTQANIDDRISCARRTFYSLTSTGLHGSNGLKPTTLYRIYMLYVLPRLLYGMETFVLQRKHINILESFHLSLLRIMQSLPQRTSRAITYLLLGAKPIEAEIHIRTLTFLGNIIRSENSTLLSILQRQIATKTPNSNSWFIYIQIILARYNLADIHELLYNMPSKESWKETVRRTVHSYWEETLLADCITKSTLQLCNIEALSIGTAHPVWSSVDSNVRDAKRAVTKARFLTGTYIVQSKLSCFNQNKVDPTCPLCQVDTEDYTHMLLCCGALLEYRTQYIAELRELIIAELGKGIWENMNKQDILEIIIDAGAAKYLQTYNLNPRVRGEIECITRRLCYSVHCGRTFLIEGVKRQRNVRP